MKKRVSDILVFGMLLAVSIVYLFYGLNISNEVERGIFYSIRLPRFILTLTAGALLSLSGTVMQTLFKNPLTDPYIMGISGGGLFGSMLSQYLFKGNLILSIVFSFSFAFIALALTIAFSKTASGDRRFTLIIGGLFTNIFFSSVVVILSILKKDEITTLFYMLMGSMNALFYQKYYASYIIILAILILSAIAIILYSKELDLISLGDEIAYTSGIDEKKIFYGMLILISLITGILVSFTGIIGFVGVIVPNVIRHTNRNKHFEILPASMLYGAFLLLLADFVAKSAMSYELPVGVVTSLIGIPFLMLILKRNNYA